MNAFIYSTQTVKTWKKHTASGGGDATKEVGEPAEQRTTRVGGTGHWRGQAQPGHPVGRHRVGTTAPGSKPGACVAKQRPHKH